MDPRGTSIRRGERGAATVEFILVLIPVVTFFNSLIQLAFIYTTQVFVEHAATNAARTAAMSLGRPAANENTGAADTPVPLGSERQALVRKSTLLALAPFILDGTIDSLTIEYPSEPGGASSPSQTFAAMSQTQTPDIRVRVRAEMICKMVFAKQLVCGGLLHPVKWLAAESVFPVERATYKPSTSCAGGSSQSTY